MNAREVGDVVEDVRAVAAVSAIAAGSLIPLSTAASARDWNRHNGGYSPQAEHFNRDGDERINRWGEARRDYGWRNADVTEYSEAPHHHRDNTGRNVALGLFAAILGLAIASEASHAHNYDDQD